MDVGFHGTSTVQGGARRTVPTFSSISGTTKVDALLLLWHSAQREREREMGHLAAMKRLHCLFMVHGV